MFNIEPQGTKGMWQDVTGMTANDGLLKKATKDSIFRSISNYQANMLETKGTSLGGLAQAGGLNKYHMYQKHLQLERSAALTGTEPSLQS